MRRLPGPAFCRLSEGDHPPEALYELFRDWQRTQTQSSVTALRSPRQQIDVWFCRAQEPMPRGIFCVLNILDKMTCTLSRACPGHPCLHLTDALHGGRQTAPYCPDQPGAEAPCLAMICSLLHAVDGSLSGGPSLCFRNKCVRSPIPSSGSSPRAPAEASVASAGYCPASVLSVEGCVCRGVCSILFLPWVLSFR
jgi:hypothetical protein